MPLRKPTDDGNGHTPMMNNRAFPPEAYQYEADVTAEAVERIQAEADKVLCCEEWVVIDGVNKR